MLNILYHKSAEKTISLPKYVNFLMRTSLTNCNFLIGFFKSRGVDRFSVDALADCRAKTFTLSACTSSLATFLLQERAPEKSSQKRTPIGKFRPLRRARRLPQPPLRRLLKKAGENFFTLRVRTSLSEKPRRRPIFDRRPRFVYLWYFVPLMIEKDR